MTPTSLLKAAGPIACATMIASCAVSRPTLAVTPPRLTLPEAATRPCDLATLPAEPTTGDLDVAYMRRGAQIATCDGARRLAVETLMAERAMQDRWAGTGQGWKKRAKLD